MGRKKGIWCKQIAVLGTVLTKDLGTLCFLLSLHFLVALGKSLAVAGLWFLSLREWGVCLSLSSLESWVCKAWYISSLTFTQVWHLQKNSTHQHILWNQTRHVMPLNEWTAICLSISLVMEIWVDSSLGWVQTVLLRLFWLFHGAHRTFIYGVQAETCWAPGWMPELLKQKLPNNLQGGWTNSYCHLQILLLLDN